MLLGITGRVKTFKGPASDAFSVTHPNQPAATMDLAREQVHVSALTRYPMLWTYYEFRVSPLPHRSTVCERLQTPALFSRLEAIAA